MVLLALLALPAVGDEPRDYSRETLVRLFAENEQREDRPRRVDFGFGTIDFRAFGMRWHIGYLPFLRPFPGTVPTTHGVARVDPFVMTGVELPYTPRTWREGRQLNAELKRIERTERERAKVVVERIKDE